MKLPRMSVPAMLLAVLCLVSAAPAAADTARYFTNIDDLPLMPGLVEPPDSTVLFDKPDGRIVSVEAVGRAATLSAESVKTYYLRTLPALGWTPIGPDGASSGAAEAGAAFEREDEILRIELSRHDVELRVRFTLAPR